MSEPDKSKIASLQDHHDPVISRLYHQSAQDQPPTALDDKILHAAHAALNMPEEAPITHNPRRPWSLLGGLAASVLVAILAVKLLPYSVQSPAPERQKRSPVGSAQVDRLAPESAAPAPSADSGAMLAAPEALTEKRELKNETILNRTEPQSRPAPEANTLESITGTETAPPSAARLSPEQIENDASPSQDEAFDKIVVLWKAGKTTEAVARFEIFQRDYPDYTPRPADSEIFQALASQMPDIIEPNKHPMD